VTHPAFGQSTKSERAEGAPHRRIPVEHVVYPGKKLVMVKFGNYLGVRDIERYAILLKADPQFRADFAEIVDLTAVEQLDLQADDFMKLADHVDPFAVDARRAFVARTSMQQHAARMHKILRSKQNIEIFSSVAAAERWVES